MKFVERDSKGGEVKYTEISHGLVLFELVKTLPGNMVSEHKQFSGRNQENSI